MKLQINVSDAFGTFADKLPEAYKKTLPEDQKRFAPRSANQLIPLAMCKLAEQLGCLDEQAIAEAQEVVSRKPGPKKKDDRQLALVDDKPGVWVSLTKIATGTVIVEYTGHELATRSVLDLRGCHVTVTAVQTAAIANWGVIPETNNGVPGLRFIPPGTPLHVEPPKPPRPSTTEVGTFVSEEQVQAGPIAILADGRTVPRNIGVDGSDKLGSDVIRFRHAELFGIESECPEDTKIQLIVNRTGESFRIANADAAELGWTVRLETRRGKKGFRYIPPGTKLRFVLPEQEIEVGE